VYIYYTGGNYIDAARTTQIASALDGAGPALVTTEVNYASDPATIAAVKLQVIAIDHCDKCLTVLAPKDGDMAGVDAILGDTNVYPNGKTMAEMVDIVGFGFRANDYPTCDANAAIAESVKFSRDILKAYSKPTIWLYAGASEGGNSDGTCRFEANAVHNFYQEIFSNAQALASAGVIGVSFYEYADRSGPLPCSPGQGCEFGIVTGAGEKYPEINSFATMCKNYGGSAGSGNPNEETDWRPLLIFSRNAEGSKCNMFDINKGFTISSTDACDIKGWLLP